MRLAGGSAIAAGLGVLLDRQFGEPPVEPHPLVVFGRVMRASEAALWRDQRLPGVAHAVGGIGFGLVTGRLLGSTTAAAYLAVGGRALDEAAAVVERALLDGDLDAARTALPSLVGRDPSGLDPSELARAVIESLAENTVDAVVAPACWAAVAGAPGALGYRAVNTLDAMVGHRSERYRQFGWASARLDDVANLVPARLTAVLVAAVRPMAAIAVWRAVRDDAPAHPSPNSGVAEAAFAAALGLRLGGPSRYGDIVELRPSLGAGRPAQPGDIAAARDLARDVARATATLLTVVGLARSNRSLRRARRSRP